MFLIFRIKIKLFILIKFIIIVKYLVFMDINKCRSFLKYLFIRNISIILFYISSGRSF